MSNDNILERIRNTIVMGHLDEDDEGFDGTMEGTPGTVALVEEAIEGGTDPQDILSVFNEAMDEVGSRYESQDFLLPDMLASAECVGNSMDVLEPHLAAGEGSKKGKFLIATVKGDLHDIGKNIVITVLKGAGYQVKDLGVDVPADDIIAAVNEFKPDFVGLSALLTTTMTEMEPVITAMREAGHTNVKVLIGGAPTSEEFARKVGADGYCRDALDVESKLEAFRTAS